MLVVPDVYFVSDHLDDGPASNCRNLLCMVVPDWTCPNPMFVRPVKN